MGSRSTRILAIIAGAVVIFGLAVGVNYLRDTGGGGGIATVGGPFRLIDQNGAEKTDKDFHGELMLVYFGYTFCPDICPTALSDMSIALDEIGDKAKQIRPVFITVDPARDTVEVMKQYVPHFHERMVALTGDEAAIAAVANAYRVYFAKSKSTGPEGEYLVDHSSIIYLMGRDGRFITHFSHGTPAEKIAERLLQHVS